MSLPDDARSFAAFLRDLAAAVEGGVGGPSEPDRRACRLPAAASDACPACGSEAAGLAQAVPGVALGRVEAGRFVPAGETELDWSAAAAARSWDGTVLVCASCGLRWAHPALRIDD